MQGRDQSLPISELSFEDWLGGGLMRWGSDEGHTWVMCAEGQTGQHLVYRGVTLQCVWNVSGWGWHVERRAEADAFGLKV